MADRPPAGRVVDASERIAAAAADRVADRNRSNPDRLVDYLEERMADTFSDRIRAALEELQDGGVSLAEIQRQTGVTAGQLSRFLRGERTLTLDTMDALAPFLRVPTIAARKRLPSK